MDNTLPISTKKSHNFVKVGLLIIIASYFAWVFVLAGMIFRPFFGEMGLGFNPIVIFYIPVDALQPYISIIPQALFYFFESLPLLWPFVIGSILLKYLLMLTLAGIPYLGFYFWARRISNIDSGNLKKIFIITWLLLIVLSFVPQARREDSRTISTIKMAGKICAGDSACTDALYAKIVKNGEYIFINGNIEKNKIGFAIPSLSSLGTDQIQSAFTDLPQSFRESYCNNLFVSKNSGLYACREKLGITDNPVTKEDCFAQTDSYSIYVPSLVQSCAQNFIKIDPIDTIGLYKFLEPLKYSNEYRQNDNTYDMGYEGYSMIPRIAILDDSTLALKSHLEDRQPLRSSYLSIFQVNPDLYQNYIEESWSPAIYHNDYLKLKTKRISFRQKMVSGQKIYEEYIEVPSYSDSSNIRFSGFEALRLSFLLNDRFIIVEVKIESEENVTGNERRMSAERLVGHIISFLNQPKTISPISVPQNKADVSITPKVINFSIKKGASIWDAVSSTDYLRFSVIPNININYKIETTEDWVNWGVMNHLYQEKTGSNSDGGSGSVTLDPKATSKLDAGTYRANIIFSPDKDSQFTPQIIEVNLEVTK